MGLEKLKAQTFFLDTAPLIYFIEGNSRYQKKLSELFQSFDRGEFTFITSTLTLLEVLVQPLKMQRVDLADQYRHLLSEASGMEVLELTASIAQKAAELRANYGLKTPDSIQMASAISRGAKFFFTNDLRLKVVQEIDCMTPDQL